MRNERRKHTDSDGVRKGHFVDQVIATVSYSQENLGRRKICYRPFAMNADLFSKSALAMLLQARVRRIELLPVQLA